MIISCDWSVKDNDNESNSQPVGLTIHIEEVVIGLSKIMIMKAIHNLSNLYTDSLFVVIGLSKIMIMKAIHNTNGQLVSLHCVVIGLSKIMIMKAIHNQPCIHCN